MSHPRLHYDGGTDAPDLERDIAAALRHISVDEREAWRRKDVLRGRLRAAYHLDCLIRGAHRIRRPLDETLLIASAVEGFTYDLYASDPLTLCWIAAFRHEQRVNGETDLVQHEVFERRGDRAGFPTVLRKAEAVFAKQRIASGLCERAVRYARLTGRVA